MTKRIVCLPGIGADHRAFSRLNLGGYQQIYGDWIPLLSSKESFEEYCQRLTRQYEITSEDVLVGLSFGGLVAQQIGKTLGNKQIILVSSFRNRRDLRFFWRACLDLRLYHLLPNTRISVVLDLASFFLHSWRAKSGGVLKDMLMDADFKLIRWSLKQIARTDLQPYDAANYLSLIGKQDLLIRSWSPTPAIKKGTHFMIYDEAQTCMRLINTYLQPQELKQIK